jgi:uncharacterized protein YbaA (DUF1428 family)
MAGYVDVYALPLPKRHLATYKRLAKRWGAVMRDYGVLEYREFVLKDPKSRFGVPFKLKRGEAMITAVVGFKSKTHRDRANARAMKDPRMQKMMKEPMIFDMKRFVMGGFQTIVEQRGAKKRGR